MFWIEHYYTFSEHGELTNDYENCLYSCRLCNRARSDSPVYDQDGRRLLNPRAEAWADHFVRTGDLLQSKPGDVNAAYTSDAYDVNDERKVALRAARREILEECLSLIEEGHGVIQVLLQEGRTEDLLAAEELRRYVNLARIVVERYAAIPPDADVECRCGRTDHHTLPSAVMRQCYQI